MNKQSVLDVPMVTPLLMVITGLVAAPIFGGLLLVGGVVALCKSLVPA